MERRTIRDCGRLRSSDGEDFGQVDFELSIDAAGQAAGMLRAASGLLHAVMNHGRCTLGMPGGDDMMIIAVDLLGRGEARFITTQPMPSLWLAAERHHRNDTGRLGTGSPPLR